MSSRHLLLLFLRISATIPWAFLFFWGTQDTQIAGHCPLQDPKEDPSVWLGLD